MSNKLNNEFGQSLIEAVVVVAVGVIVMGSLVFATIASLRNAQFAQNQAQATKLAQEALEQVRSARNRNIDPAITGLGTEPLRWDSNPLWNNRINSSCLDPCYFKLIQNERLQYVQAGVAKLPDGTEVQPNSPFKRVIQLSDDPATYGNEKIVTSIVTWDDFSGSHESKLVTIMTKPE